MKLLLHACRAAYVGVNTWDLMDKSRDTSARPEILSRLDAMVKAGWSVGRTWGFSLGGWPQRRPSRQGHCRPHQDPGDCPR